MTDVETAEPDRRSRRLLLLISGLPAVGKSSVVAELGPRLHAAQLSRDELRRSAGTVRRLVDTIGFRLLRRRLAVVQRWATAALLDEVNAELQGGRCVIVEALAEPELRDELAQLATAAAARFVIVECECGNEAEYERRLATRPKHWEAVVRRLTQTHEPAVEAISVDTSASPANSADQILAAIGR